MKYSSLVNGIIGFGIIVSCSPPNQLKSEYDPIVTQLFGAGPRLRCNGFQNHPTLGVLRGCLGNRGDTLVYLWSNRPGAIVAFGRRWTVDAAQSRQVYDSLSGILTSAEGTQPLTCADKTDLVDRRWANEGVHQALILQFPRADLIWIDRLTQFGPPNCAEGYALPLGR